MTTKQIISCISAAVFALFLIFGLATSRPDEKFSLNGLREPTDSVSYIVFLVGHGPYYHAVPLRPSISDHVDAIYDMTDRECRSTDAVLTSLSCTVNGLDVICFH